MTTLEARCSESDETLSTEGKGDQAPVEGPVFFGNIPLTPSRKAAVKAKLVAQFKLRSDKEARNSSSASLKPDDASSKRVKKLVEAIEFSDQESKKFPATEVGLGLKGDFESPLFSSKFTHKVPSPMSDFGTPISRITAYSENVSETTPHKEASAKSDIIATPKSVKRFRARSGSMVNSPSLCARRIATPKSVRMREPVVIKQVVHTSQEDIHSVPDTLLPIPREIFTSCKPYPQLMEIRNSSQKRKRKSSSKEAKKRRKEPEFEIELKDEAYINRVTGTIVSILRRNLKENVPWIFKSKSMSGC